MTTDTILQSKPRTETGSTAARRLRRAGELPASVVLLGGTDTVEITVNQHEFDQLLRHHTGESLILDVDIPEKGPMKLLTAEVQRDYVSGRTVHIDFHEISMSEKVTLTISVELTGEAAGVIAGGTLEQVIREVEVECLPVDVIEKITLDVSEMDIGDSVNVADLVVDPKITITTDGELVLAQVVAAREEEEEEAEEGEEGAEEGAQEPEVIGKADKEESEEE